MSLTTPGTPPPDTGVIVVAAGRGARLGATLPKAFVRLNGEPLLAYSVRTITTLPACGHLVIVVPATHVAEAHALTQRTAAPGSRWNITVVVGGAERDESVRLGLAALTPSVRTVLIHDAARPLTPPELFTRVAAQVALRGESVIPALPVTDTIKRIRADGTVQETVDRSTLVAVQTPQGFPRDLLVAAHQHQLTHPTPDNLPTDDAEVIQRAGGTIRTEPGDALAMKVTTAADFTVLSTMLSTLPHWFDTAPQTHTEVAV